MKILYMSCHSILEFDEVRLFHEMGHTIFSPGAYIEPTNPGDSTLRPGIPGLVYDPDILEQFHKIAADHPGKDIKDYLTKEFVDNFDCVIVMHLPRWIVRNWEVMKHKRVIWRTIGQSVASTEAQIKPFRDQGLEIVRYSPSEVHIPNQNGCDALIRFYKDPDDYGPWNGETKRVITFGQHMKQRNAACGFDVFDTATQGFDRGLFGPGNEGEPWMHGKVPFEQLREEMCNNRVYFYTGTHPASYTLNFIEAWMSGIPIVAIGPKLGNAPWCRDHSLYEIPSLITQSCDGFVSDNLEDLRQYIKLLFDFPEVAKLVGEEGRKNAIHHFGKDVVFAAWEKYLKDGPQK